MLNAVISCAVCVVSKASLESFTGEVVDTGGPALISQKPAAHCHTRVLFILVIPLLIVHMTHIGGRAVRKEQSATAVRTQFRLSSVVLSGQGKVCRHSRANNFPHRAFASHTRKEAKGVRHKRGAEFAHVGLSNMLVGLSVRLLVELVAAAW
jgi:hypothetical protein